jgi:hypothetical protein
MRYYGIAPTGDKKLWLLRAANALNAENIAQKILESKERRHKAL